MINFESFQMNYRFDSSLQCAGVKRHHAYLQLTSVFAVGTGCRKNQTTLSSVDYTEVSEIKRMVMGCNLLYKMSSLG